MKARKHAKWLITALAAFVAIGGSVAVAHAVEQSPPLAQLDGQLMVAHGDAFGRGNAMVMQTALRTANGIVPVTLPAARHTQALALAGKRVRVRGSRTAGVFNAVSVTAASAAAPPAPRHYRIATVIFGNPKAKVQPYSMETVRDAMYGPEPYSVASYLETASGGQLDVSGTAYGPYAMPTKVAGGSCDLAGWDEAGASAATADGYNPANFDTIVVYAPKSCSFAGIAWVGSGGVFMANDLSGSTVEHELGHNLGLWHAGYIECSGAFSSSCPVVTYGDPSDVMGDGWGDYDGIHKLELGWIPQSELVTQTSGTRTYSLAPAETPVVAGSTEIVEVPRHDGTKFEVERRDRLGNDSGGAAAAGLYVKLVNFVGTDDSEYVAYLTPGTPWVDTSENLTFLALNATDVKVCFGTCTNGGGGASTTSTSTSTSSSTSTSTSSSTTTTINQGGDAVAVSVVKGRIEVVGTTGNDTVHVTKVHDSLKTVDANGAPIVAGAGCHVDGSAVVPTVDCRGGGFDADMGDGNDTVIVDGTRMGIRNVLDGGAGNDRFVGGLGAETFIGGGGDDTVDYGARPPGSLTVDVGGGPQSGAHGEHDDIHTDVEHVLLP